MLTKIEHKTYESLYQDHTLDPMGLNDDSEKLNRLTAAFHGWRTKDAPLSDADWKEMVSDDFADHNIGGVGVMVMQDSGKIVLQVLVGIKKYNSDPSNPTSKLLKHHYAFAGDVDGGNGEIVKVDWAMGEMTSDVNVYKEAHHKKKLEDNPTAEILGPVKDDDAQVETLSVRKSVYIPYCLMRLVLDQDLSPRKAFLLLFDFIHANNLVCCQSVLDFCRVAATMAKSGDLTPVVARDTAGNITAVSIDRPLQRFMKEKVAYRDLKGLRPGQVTESPIALKMSAAVAALTDVTLKADARNEQKMEMANETKDIETLFPGSKLESLAAMIKVPSGEEFEDGCPVVFSLLANKKKNNSNHSIFNQAVRDTGKSLKIKPPILPLRCVTALLGLNWEGIDIADLGSGILPMGFIPPGAISPKAKVATLALLRAIQSSDDASGNMTVADSVMLNQAGGSGFVPQDFTESDIQIKCFTPVLVTMVGANHELVEEYGSCRAFIEDNKLEFQQALVEECGASQAPAMQSFLFHHLVHTYFRMQSNSSTSVKPHSLSADLLRWDSGGVLNWLPSLLRVPSLNALSQRSQYVKVKGGGGGGDGGGPASGGKKSDLGKRVVNPNCDPRFNRNTTLGSKINKLTITKIINNNDFDESAGTGLGVPCNDSGEEHCLTYHGKGSCQSGCKKAYSHLPLIDSAKETMYAFFANGCRSRAS